MFIACSGVFRYGRNSKPIINVDDIVLDWTSRVGVVGDNGSGKTTFLRLLSGDPTLCSRHFRVRVSREAAESRWCVSLSSDLGGLSHYTVHNLLRAKKALEPSLVSDVDAVLDRWGLADVKPRTRVGSLSLGNRQRLGLALAVGCASRGILVLDEPTTGLDQSGVDHLVAAVAGWDGPVLISSHDFAFLDRVVDSVLVFELEAELNPSWPPDSSELFVYQAESDCVDSDFEVVSVLGRSYAIARHMSSRPEHRMVTGVESALIASLASRGLA